jgi:hypothetical protein
MMALEYDPQTSKIKYKGREIGEYVYEDGRARVRLNITYECDSDDWVVPLSWFDHGLNLLPENQPKSLEMALQIKTGEDSIECEHNVPRLLTEKTVKRNGYIWVFHKNDADEWPSLIHAHDYDKGLKLDAITGKIFDAATKEHCKDLKRRDLAVLQNELRMSRLRG